MYMALALHLHGRLGMMSIDITMCNCQFPIMKIRLDNIILDCDIRM